MDSEEGIKIFNVVEEIKQYQKKIAKLKQENKQLKDKLENTKCNNKKKLTNDDKQTNNITTDITNISLEHTELLTNVRKTLSLLRFMTNNIKADSLRKRSIRIRLNYK